MMISKVRQDFDQEKQPLQKENYETDCIIRYGHHFPIRQHMYGGPMAITERW